MWEKSYGEKRERLRECKKTERKRNREKKKYGEDLLLKKNNGKIPKIFPII